MKATELRESFMYVYAFRKDISSYELNYFQIQEVFLKLSSLKSMISQMVR